MKFVLWLLTNAAGLAVAAWLLDGIAFSGDTWQDKLTPLLVMALIFGVVTYFVRPLVRLLSLPFIILTLGLFLWVINAWMLMLSGWLADKLDVGFEVSGFWTALAGALMITLVTAFFNVVFADEREEAWQ